MKNLRWLNVLLMGFLMSGLLWAEEDESEWGFKSILKKSIDVINQATPDSEGDASEKNAPQELVQNSNSASKADAGPSSSPVTEDISSMDSASLKSMTKNIQAMLTNKGFDAGVADGMPGKQTRDAICHYQISQNLPVDPRPSVMLHEHLTKASGAIETKKYTGLMRHQCEIAHLNNVNNIEAVENHSYEGTLTTDDLMCKEIVAPFKIESNLKILFSGAAENILNILKAKDDEMHFDKLREKAKKANWLPLDVEILYGESIHKDRVEQTGKLLSRNNKRRYVRELYAKGDAVLARVLSAMDEKYPYDFKLFIIDDRQVNAEAIPGGYLYVNAGVFETVYAELVVSHEIAHVLRRHTTKELQARLVDSVETVDDLKKLVSKKSKNTEAILEKVLLLRGAIVQYSQQQELQSDACAVRMAMKLQHPELNQQISGYISDIEKDHIKITKNTSSHPAYPERKDRMLDVYKEVAANGATSGG